MVARRQTDLGTLFQEALRAHIGESRYQMWFGSGVRFAFEGNALTALVDTPFMVDWLKDGYARVFAQVGKDLFGQEITNTGGQHNRQGNDKSVSADGEITDKK